VTAPWNSLVRARRLAGRQKNLITYEQARGSGLSSNEIRGLARRGEWDRVFRGVFSIGASEPSWQQQALAVCLAGGRGVAASHETAAALMWLDGISSPPGVIHVTTLRRVRVRDTSVTVHETSRPFGIRRIQGVPATLVERTLLDLAATADQGAVELALEDALRRRLTTIARIDATLARDGGKGRPGAKMLREMTGDRRASAPTGSGLEAKVSIALMKTGLRGMVRQYPVTRPNGSDARIDLAFPDFKIAIEVDSYRWHSGREAWHRDLARRNDLIALGWTVLHATKEDVDEGCMGLVRTIRKLMGLRTLDLERP
jgi:very-short-patch-repair endonuclease